MNGILLVDKPVDWTSHDVVAKLRGVLGERRMGHSGTLDPMATGLLVVFAGRATRAVSFSENHSKCYEARLRLGLTTDTQDTTGTVLSRCDRRVTRAELEAVLPQFRGDILQVPSMYSALKVDGKKLYEIARRGGEVVRAARPITIGELTVLGEADGDYVLRVRCSKGTYIRTLCHDIGAALGCGGDERPAPDGGRRVSRGGCAPWTSCVRCRARRRSACPAGGQPLAGRAAGHC
ncbi:MAG: tRNA pseudouridine(55) synthase TruB [Oscillospiraceae bacterium]